MSGKKMIFYCIKKIQTNSPDIWLFIPQFIGRTVHRYRKNGRPMKSDTKTKDLNTNLTPPNLNDLISGGLGIQLTEKDVCDLLMNIERENILSKYTFPTKPDSKGCYRIYVNDITAPRGKKQLYASNLEKLKEKVYCHEKHMPRSVEHITFADAFKFAQNFELNNVSRERQFSRNNTIDKNESAYKRFFEGTGFAQKPLSNITLKDIDYTVRTTIKKYDLTKKGMETIRGIINMTFKRAIYMEWIDDNPAARILWKDYKKLLREPTPIQERSYSKEEMKEIRDFLKKKHTERPKYIPAYALEFQLLTGMRRGEIPPLRWEDVDFEAGTIYIHQELISQQCKRAGMEQICSYTKNGKARYYPIADLEEEFLRRLKAVDEKYYPNSPFLFPADSKNGCITNNMVYQFFRRMCGKLDIPISKDRIRGTHAFRRNAITEVINKSAGNVVLTAQMFGNSPETIRKHYYVGEDIERKREILNMRSFS